MTIIYRATIQKNGVYVKANVVLESDYTKLNKKLEKSIEALEDFKESWVSKAMKPLIDKTRLALNQLKRRIR